MTRLHRYLENAHRCLALADRYEGTHTQITLEGAARSWMLLYDLEQNALRDGLWPSKPPIQRLVGAHVPILCVGGTQKTEFASHEEPSDDENGTVHSLYGS